MNDAMDCDYDQVMKDLDYQQTIDELEYKNHYYQAEVDNLSSANKELQGEINDLNDAIHELLDENDELVVDAQNARRSFTALQVAVSALVFVYGMMYGSYLCPK